jgi:hypothetical protein
MGFPLVFFYFDAFSSREPVPTSLENAMGLFITRLLRTGDKHAGRRPSPAALTAEI